MSFSTWLFGKGIAGAISSDLIEKYKGIKLQHPSENDGKILERVWNFWLTLNEDKIISEDDEDKVARLSIIKEKSEGKSELDQFSKFKTLFDLYQDILYIETEVSSSDGKIWKNSMKVFLEESAKNGFDFSKEYNSYKRILGGAR